MFNTPKIISSMLLAAALSSNAFAQRSCATMEYYQQRLEQDPTLADRMAAEEVAIQQWMQAHPVPIPASPVNWPALPGFTPTGDEVRDRLNYSSVKEAYNRAYPKPLPQLALTEEQLKAAHEARIKKGLTIINK